MPQPTPTIVVTDAANGSGANVQVTGSDPASVNTAWVCLSDRLADGGFHATAFSRIGDGTIGVGIGDLNAVAPNGVNLTHAWYVRVVSVGMGGTATSSYGLVCPTRGLPSYLFKALVATQFVLINAGIGAIGGRVYRGEDQDTMFAKLAAQTTAILLFPQDPEAREPAGNFTTLWRYRIRVMIVDNDGDWYALTEEHAYNRQIILDTFDRQRIAFIKSQVGARRVVVEPGPYMMPAGGGNFQKWQSPITLCFEVDRYTPQANVVVV